MATITSENFAFPVQWAKDHLINAQNRFNKEPNAVNWNVCVRAMLTHQQLGWSLRSPSVDKNKLFKELEQSPIGDWQDLICLNALGLSCADAIKQSA